jgi:hypothetical protein
MAMMVFYCVMSNFVELASVEYGHGGFFFFYLSNSTELTRPHFIYVCGGYGHDGFLLVFYQELLKSPLPSIH